MQVLCQFEILAEPVGVSATYVMAPNFNIGPSAEKRNAEFCVIVGLVR